MKSYLVLVSESIRKQYLVHANSEEEAMKKFNEEDYDEANVTEPHSMQGEDDDFEEIVCVSDYCEKEE